MRRFLGAALLLAVASGLDVLCGPYVGSGFSRSFNRYVSSGFSRSVSAAAPVPSVRLLDLDGRLVDPFLAAEDHQAIVFLFASVDCPISNRYAPVVKRLHDQFAPQRVAFWMVYPNPAESPAAIQKHLEAFSYPVHALRDPSHELVKLAKAVVTPEAAVFDKARTLVYHGRIDDRYVSLGVERPVASRHDLADALTAAVSGQPVREPVTQAVGCYIADFVP